MADTWGVVLIALLWYNENLHFKILTANVSCIPPALTVARTRTLHLVQKFDSTYYALRQHGALRIIGHSTRQFSKFKASLRRRTLKVRRAAKGLFTCAFRYTIQMVNLCAVNSCVVKYSRHISDEDLLIFLLGIAY
jgi:hypothetical protein